MKPYVQTLTPAAAPQRSFNQQPGTRAKQWAGSSAWYTEKIRPKNVRFANQRMVEPPEGRGFKSRPVHQELNATRLGDFSGYLAAPPGAEKKVAEKENLQETRKISGP